MNITLDTDGDAAVIALDGRFDAHEVDRFRAELDRVAAGGARHLSVDLDDVNFLDSSALAELVRGMKHARQEGGDLTLRSPSDPVRVILELTGLDRAFEITTS